MMSFTVCSGGSVLIVRVSGELSSADCRAFLARLESLTQSHDHVRVFFELGECRGCDPSSAWNEPTFSLHFKDRVRRFAVVGKDQTRDLMQGLAEAFLNARIFPIAEREEALRWITEGVEEENKDQIRRLAYAKWEAAGRPAGDGLPFWVAAERELYQAS